MKQLNSVKIGDVCKLINGRAFKPIEWKKNGLPIVRIQNLNNENSEFNYCDLDIDKRFHINNGELLFSWSGTPGTSFGAFFWNRGKALLNQHIFKVTIDDSKIDKNYFRYAMNSKLLQIIEQAHGGVGLKHITKKKLEAITLYLPDLNSQKDIAKILDTANELKQKDNALITKYNELLESLFLNMFGDPNINPKCWEIVQLSAICEKITDGTHITPKYVDHGVEFISAKNVKDYQINFGDVKYITAEEHFDLIKRCKVDIGDILITKSGSLGMAAMLEIEREFSIFESLALIKYSRSEIEGKFLLYLLNTPSTQHQHDRNKKGVGVKHLHLVDLRKLKIIRPPINLQKQFAKQIENIEKQKQQAQASLNKSEELFNCLLQKAFKGELVT